MIRAEEIVNQIGGFYGALTELILGFFQDVPLVTVISESWSVGHSSKFPSTTAKKYWTRKWQHYWSWQKARIARYVGTRLAMTSAAHLGRLVAFVRPCPSFVTTTDVIWEDVGKREMKKSPRMESSNLKLEAWRTSTTKSYDSVFKLLYVKKKAFLTFGKRDNLDWCRTHWVLDIWILNSFELESLKYHNPKKPCDWDSKFAMVTCIRRQDG